MDPAQSKNSQESQSQQKLFCKQPITCPWIATQPYPSTVSKNRACDFTAAKPTPNIPLSMESRTINEKTCPSLQHSSSQFFYFLRLMQLFPETHPATLHTVLCLCKNDFFCAVDKLLYAKRCKALYSRSQGMFKRCAVSRSHPYCAYGNAGKVMTQQERTRSSESLVNNARELVDLHKDSDGTRAEAAEGSNLDMSDENNGIPLIITENKPHTPTPTTIQGPVIEFPHSSPKVTSATTSTTTNNGKAEHGVTSAGAPGGNVMETEEIRCKAPQV